MKAGRCLIGYPSRPFVRGGTERLVDALVGELERREHEVERLALPSLPGDKTRVLEEALQWSSLDLGASYPGDLVITTKFPSYLAIHPRKIVWLFHQYREIYDLYGSPLSSFKNEVLDHDIRETLMRWDREALSGAHRLCAISKNVAGRVERYLDLACKVVYPPSPLSGRLRSGAPGDFVLSVSRLDANKRVDLLLKALAREKSLRARIVGDGPLRQALEAEAAELGVRDRASFLGAVSDEELIELYSGAGAVFIGPLDEDFGLSSLEALEAERPVVVTSDCGGPLELIENEESGLVAAPEPEAIGEALHRVVADPALSRRLGQAGRDSIRSITWSAVLAELLD